MTQTLVLKTIKELASKHSDIDVVWLYGSRTGENYNDNSDFDLAIAFKNFDLSSTDKYLRPNELAIEWTEKLGLPQNKISLVDINLVPVYLSFNIVEYGEIIYQTETLRAYREQNRIYSQYEFQMIENKISESTTAG